MYLVLLLLVVLAAVLYVLIKLKQWRKTPPGPWGLPVLGYLPFLDANQPHISLTKLARKYGPIYSINMGSVFTVVLSDHKLVREAFAKDAFSGRAPLFLTHGIMHGNGIICAEGALWKDQRKLVSMWMKNFGMSKHSVSRQQLERRIAVGALELLQDVDAASELTVPMDLTHMLTNSLGNVVNELVFGFKFPPKDQTWDWLRQIQEDGCHEIGVAGVVNFLPFIRFFSKAIRKTIRLLVRGQAQTHRVYASIVAQRRKMLGLQPPKGSEYDLHAGLEKEHPEGWVKCKKYSKSASPIGFHFFDPNILIPTKGECVLDNFLWEQKKRFEEGDSASMFVTDEQLLFLLADLFGAGLDTTSVTLSWLMVYMALNQHEQDAVRKEILTVYPTDADVDGARLPRLMAALCETQRIRAVVPVGIPHGCLQESTLGGYTIPVGAMVVPLQWAIHMDAAAWEEPDVFRPSRFLAPDGTILKPQEFIPFQTGKRMCPGDELSRMLACGFAARLLRRLRLRLADPPPVAPPGDVGVTLAPPHLLYYADPL